jgi:hypothetical protein
MWSLGCVKVAFDRFREGSSTTTFAVPGGFEQSFFERRGFFFGEPPDIRLSTASNLLPRDGAGDGKGAGVFSDDDFETGH